ncbi:MAG: ferredoxin family protein [Chloroflexi bacterium]|nr:ferredoxin family protein [Chloroflexota bacterium]
MGIRKIDPRRCDGCRICADHCPMDVIRMDEDRNKAFIKYLDDCQSCFLCEAECPKEAIWCYPVREKRVAPAW